MKTCITCDEFDPSDDTCYHHSKRVQEPLRGELIWTGIISAKAMRAIVGSPIYCGPYGKFWTPIHTKTKNPFPLEGE